MRIPFRILKSLLWASWSRDRRTRANVKRALARIVGPEIKEEGYPYESDGAKVKNKSLG